MGFNEKVVELGKEYDVDVSSILKQIHKNNVGALANGIHKTTSGKRAKNDWYATNPMAIPPLLARETFSHNILECCAGRGHLSKELEKHGFNVTNYDIVDRGCDNIIIKDFLKSNEHFDGDIITNPPYSKALEFAEKALETVGEGNKVALFLKVIFLEGRKRYDFFKKNPPKKVYVFSYRIGTAKNGEEERFKVKTMMAHAWFVWEKGYQGKTIVDWIN